MQICTYMYVHLDVCVTYVNISILMNINENIRNERQHIEKKECTYKSIDISAASYLRVPNVAQKNADTYFVYLMVRYEKHLI